MKIRYLLSFIFVFCSAATALDREAFTFTQYDLEVRLEPEQQRLAVRGTMTLRNDSTTPQKNASLQISSSLAWRSIQIGGKPVQFVSQPYTSDIDHTGALSEAIIAFPQVIPAAGTVQIEVGYEGTIPLDVTRLTRIGVPEGDARHSDWDQMSTSFSAVRGMGYVTWYPVATDSANLSQGNSVFETVGRWQAREQPSGMRVNLCQLAGGSQLAFMNDTGQPATPAPSTKTQGFSCREHRFDPLGTASPSFVVGSYELLGRPNAQIYYFPQDKNLASDYGLAGDLAEHFVRDWFGPPSQKVHVFELEDPDAAPFESGSSLMAPLSIAKDSRLAQMTAVHQFVHAAFHSNRPWIEEGIAHFAQAVYREQQSSREAGLEFMGLHRAAIVESEKAIAAQNKPANTSDESLVNTSLPEFYRSKAMYVWWMLRDMLGDTELKKALAAYRAEQDQDPAYIQHLLEKQSKRDLEWFFDGWVYRDKGLPDFQVEAAVPRPVLGGAYVVTVTVQNLGSAGAEVPVRVVGEGGEVVKRLQVPANTKASIRIEVPSIPQEVVVNDGSVPETDFGNNSMKIPVPKAP